MDDDVQQAGTSHDIQFPPIVEHPNYSMFEAPLVTFKSIDWTAANVPMFSELHVPYSIWKRGNEFHKELCFADNIDLKIVVRQYSVDTYHEFKVVESESNLWVVKCKNMVSEYNWKLRAIKQTDYFEITKYIGPYICISTILSQDHSRLSSNFITNKIWNLVKKVSTIFITSISAVIKNRFNYTASYRKLWEAKQKAMALVYGD